MRRFRPIMLTTLTTFGGLTPIIFETSNQANHLIPMAISHVATLEAQPLVRILDVAGASGPQEVDEIREQEESMLSENKDIENTFADYHKSEKRKYMAYAVIIFATLAAITIYGVGQMAVI